MNEKNKNFVAFWKIWKFWFFFWLRLKLNLRTFRAGWKKIKLFKGTFENVYRAQIVTVGTHKVHISEFCHSSILSLTILILIAVTFLALVCLVYWDYKVAMRPLLTTPFILLYILWFYVLRGGHVRYDSVAILSLEAVMLPAML